jgi:hypothetical protein
MCPEQVLKRGPVVILTAGQDPLEPIEFAADLGDAVPHRSLGYPAELFDLFPDLSLDLITDGASDAAFDAGQQLLQGAACDPYVPERFVSLTDGVPQRINLILP